MKRLMLLPFLCILCSCATYMTVKHGGINIVDAVTIDAHIASEVGGYVIDEIQDALEQSSPPMHKPLPALMCETPTVKICSQNFGCWCE